MTHALDPAVRSLAKGASQATVEYVVEILRDEGFPDAARGLVFAKLAIAERIAEATMGAADDDPTSEVHQLRAGTASRTRPVGWGTT